MWVTKKTQYGGDVVMFLNKIIKNKKLNYPQKNVGLAHGFKTIKPCAVPTLYFADNSIFYFLLFC